MAAIILDGITIDLCGSYSYYEQHNDSATLEKHSGDNYELKIGVTGSDFTLRAPMGVMIMVMQAMANELGAKVVPIAGKDDELGAMACDEYFDADGVYHKNVPAKKEPSVKSTSYVKRNTYGASNTKPDAGTLIPFSGASQDVFSKEICSVGFSARLENTLLENKVYNLLNLVSQNGKALLMLPNFGQASLREVDCMLAGMGLRLGMSYQDILDYRNRHKDDK